MSTSHTLDQLATKSLQHLSLAYGEVQTSALSVSVAAQRTWKTECMLRALDAMAPEAADQLLKLAEAMARKHPAAPRLHLVRAGLSNYPHDKKEAPNG